MAIGRSFARYGLSFATAVVVVRVLSRGLSSVGTGIMAFGVKTVRDVKPFGKHGRRSNSRFVPASLFAGLGVVVSLGTVAATFAMQGAFMPHVAGRSIPGTHGLAERPLAASRLALAAPHEATPRNPKFPRVPELTHTPWQASNMDEGSVIGPSGEISVITPPKPKIVVAAQAPLAAEAFGARASGVDTLQVAGRVPLTAEAFGVRVDGLDTMQVASVQTYSIFDETRPVTAPSVAAQAVAVAALEDAPPPVGTLPQGPFSLVLAEEEPAADDDISASVPLPGIRPRRPADDAVLPSAKTLKRAPAALLAYAPQDNDIRDSAPSYRPAPLFAARGRTAIYDIAAATVYMPNGERLEAHSGMGPMLDNPRYVNKRMRGPTPPHTYNLTMREALFHGVEAIRLNPVDPSKIYGRDGLLAHTYMLGRRGDSNGCLVFKDYRRFLAAFKRGEVTQLVVVARMSSASTRVASR
jgi:hypothetical protein